MKLRCRPDDVARVLAYRDDIERERIAVVDVRAGETLELHAGNVSLTVRRTARLAHVAATRSVQAIESGVGRRVIELEILVPTGAVSIDVGPSAAKVGAKPANAISPVIDLSGPVSPIPNPEAMSDPERAAHAALWHLVILRGELHRDDPRAAFGLERALIGGLFGEAIGRSEASA